MNTRRRVSLLMAFLVCSGLAPGCREEQTISPRRVETIAFHSTSPDSVLVNQRFGLGPDSRPSFVSWAPVEIVSVTFESDPIEVDAGAVLLTSLGIKSFGLRVHARDQPKFRVDVIGPGGREQILAVTALVDFPADQWVDYRLALPPKVGSPITLHFEIIRPNQVPAGASRVTPIWEVPRLVRASEIKQPNILFVVFDTLRADHTQVYGYDRNTTPFLSKLASRGAKVRDFIATYPTTLSSHWSMFTGLLPIRHGVYPGTKVKTPSAPTLAQQFQQAGYRTAAFTEGEYVHSLFGFGQGFDLYHDGPAIKLEDQSGAAEATFGLAYEWLRALEGEPFFLFLHTYQVHSPYAPPARYRKMFAGEYEGRWRNEASVEMTFNVNDGTTDLNASELANVVNLYDAEIRQLDDLFAALWKKLEAAGFLEDTIVILTSDHGEDLMEHGWLQHGTTLYDPALRVPFIVVAPGRVAANATLDCQRPQTDLMPTVLELAGLPVPSGIDGTSLASELLRGSCKEDHPAFSELVESTYERDAGLPLVSLREGGWKLIRHPKSGQLEAYDLINDADEEHNRESDLVPAGLQARLDNYLAQRPHDTDPSEKESIDDEAPEITPEVRDRLKALGYLP